MMRALQELIMAVSVGVASASGRSPAQTAERPVQQPAIPAPPLGVWRNIEEGIVVRFAPCAEKFCAVVVGVPAAMRARGDGPRCGTEFLSGFVWNGGERRWDGKLRIPDGSRTITARLTTDGANNMRVTARMALLSKTLKFELLKEIAQQNCPG